MADPTIPKLQPSIIREYRIILPLSVEEYRIGQLYEVCKASKHETGGGEGLEFVLNEPASLKDGTKTQYTHKIVHLESKLPNFIRILAPKGSCEIHEKAWNYYPECRTEYSNPDYMKDGFYISIDSRHESGNSEEENIFGLTDEELAQRQVDRIDIVNDPVDSRDYKESDDPTIFNSTKTGRGPFVGDSWKSGQQPVMCIYKLYRVTFQWWGLQSRVESVIMKSIRRLLLNTSREVVCSIDAWLGKKIEDIRALEEKTKQELDDMRSTGEMVGMKEK